MRYSVVKANYRHWRKMYQQAGDPERTMVRAVVRAYGYGDDWKKRAEEAEAKYQLELQYRLALSRTVNAELKLLEQSQKRAEKWKARAEELEERNDTTPLDAIKTVVEYSEFRGWANDEAIAAYRTLGDWLQFRK